jgi:hypothetical protein
MKGDNLKKKGFNFMNKLMAVISPCFGPCCDAPFRGIFSIEHSFLDGVASLLVFALDFIFATISWFLMSYYLHWYLNESGQFEGTGWRELDIKFPI